MNILGRVLILTACVLAACAVPHIKPSTFSNLSTIMGHHKAQKACLKQYHERQDDINNQMNIQTAACISASNQTTNSSTVEITTEVNIIRTNLTTLQDNISNCTSLTDNLFFVQCVQSYNDMNTKLLSNAQHRAQDVEMQINNTQTVNGGSIKTCIDKVMMDGTRNFTIATNDYANCMNNIYNPVKLH